MLVIGSGMTGALVGWMLAEAGLDVVAVDRRPLTTGSTAASTALLQIDLDTLLTGLSGMFGFAFAASVYRRVRASLDELASLVELQGIDCDLARRPSLLLAGHGGDTDELRAEVAARRKAGLDAELLDARALRNDFGVDRAGALLSPVALEFDPLKLCRGLWARSILSGVRLYPETAVIDQRWTGAQPVVHTSTGHAIDTTHIVFATGYEAPEMFPELRQLITLQSTFVATTPPVPRNLWPQRAIISERATPYCYARTTPDARILIGGGDIEGVDPVRQQRLLPDKTRDLLATLASLFPNLPAMSAERAWAGAFAATADGLPYIGMSDFAERCHFALGYGGNGMVLSIVAAEIIRDAILARTNPAAHLFAFDRVSKPQADRMVG